MRKTLEAIDFPVQDYVITVDRHQTTVQIISAAPKDMPDAAVEAMLRFKLEVKPDTLDLKELRFSTPTGDRLGAILVWQASWQHGGKSTPPRIKELSYDTCIEPRS